MYLFYIDETGNRDPRLQIPRKDGTCIAGDWLYVLTAVSIFESQWHGFEKTLNRQKSSLTQRIHHDHGLQLELADCEVKSNWIRQPAERASRPFLGNLTERELIDLIELYYRQLDHHNMYVFSVLVDKRHLHSYMDQEKLHRKSWELLMEQIERFMRAMHGRHQAIMVVDDVAKEMNRSLAMKHAYIMDQGTAHDTWLRHLCEMPMFVRSELSNGVQLADLCGYNIYRAFKNNDLKYPFFQRIAPAIWSTSKRMRPPARPFSGLYVFPPGSPLIPLVEQFEKEKAPAVTS